ncbi:MAG: hypothetical protein ACYS8L_04470, partial [Planctomycetota bacterium]
MNAEWQQLAHAYRLEEDLYRQVLDLVDKQEQLMDAEPDPGSVLELCESVDGLMAGVAAIEARVQPLKERWEKTRDDPDGELMAVLSSIERLIEKIARAQERVQSCLLAHVDE